ncbi:MAG TPA: NTP transferase domain-containing protein [Bacteroidales bacterium]|nr:NTP transferase domain-containing protein [Bacteroidales bacterium]HPJ60318.1 NTP transferase domain-containing protein [Bacteroidales bacterium]
MAAGRGSRLGKMSETIPKVLLDINGKSLLRLAVENCTAAGFSDIIVNIHHLAGLVKAEINALRKEGFRISISDESERLLETGGGLFRARGFFGKEPFLLANADTITDLDLKALYDYHLEKKGLATLAVRKREGTRLFLVDRNGLLRGWCNKSTGEKIIAGTAADDLEEIAFSGRHIISPEIFDYMDDGVYTMTALYLKLIPAHNIFTYRSDGGFWLTAGTPEELEEARIFFRNH